MSELYKEAAELLQKLERRQGGLKSLAYAENVQHKRSSFALVCETLRYKPLLQELLTAVPQFKLQKKLKDTQRALLLVSLYDLLFGRQKIQGGGHLKKELVQHANAFKTALVRMKIKAKVSTNEALLPKENRRLELALPRYVRVNTLLITREETEAFIKEYSAKQDEHLRDLLVLPPGTELHEHELVKSGKLILQDKASCFSAFVLHGERSDKPGRAGDVIDACAAPGNKTSHAAMLIRQKPEIYEGCRVFAFDRSAKRLDLLKRRMKLAGADEVVEPCCQSFLDVKVDDPKYANVRSILLDPSCSGSGMTNRLDHLLDIASSQDQLDTAENEYEEDVASRLQSLADFQLEALLKAFSFPQVERVAYSTCSIFQKENEEVVVNALQSKQNRSAKRPFVLLKCLPTWHRRGMVIPGLNEEQAQSLVRADGHEDSTNGFFVAYFERTDRADGEEVADETEDAEEEAEEDDESTEAVGTKRKQLSDAQKEARKRRKKDKLKRKKEQQRQSTTSTE
ncbi:hypothetical protein Poli38472_003404 [Pythium oligandrum]|uniref:SAM-dependent MTase RsmB/NOP-type domain-containing protein n=1 Tax=Pythium oligandrum TaxID=41045 RepID=A0A8K1FE13_PYTOL|nr:hypothetical protein Poli38472_003404 [Pythium oligandrum]|eukprot:TMW57479.1 hypothetical protein Poli38472_003404 [Pythium oligandrum]